MISSLLALASLGILPLQTIGTFPSESTDTLRNVMLDDIEVVSTVKEHGQMRQQPSAVTLIGIRQLETSQSTSLKGASRLVPNLFIPDYGSRLTSAIYIRGIGSRLNTPAVGLYVDNIPYIDKSAFDFNFYDIERVDVLRGPQGTLYGRNTMGGLVRVYTLDPFHGEGTTLRMGYATGDNHRTLSLTHFHRVAENLAFSAGGYYEGSDGFFDNVTTGRKVDDMQSGGGRIRAIWLPTKQWKIDASLSYDYSDEGAYPYFHTYETGETTIANNREHSYRRSLLNAGVNIEYATDNWQMNAITGYQHLNDRMFLDQDFRAVDIYSLEQKQRINTLTEEITLKSRNSEFWQHVSGIHLMCQTLHTTGPVTFYDDGLRWLEGNINANLPDVSQIAMLNAMQFEQMGVNFRGNALIMDGTYDTPTLGAALFHQSTLHLTEALSATLGVRFDYEHQQMKYHSPAEVDYGFTMPNATNEKMAVNLQDLHASILYEGKLKHDRMRILPKVALKYDFTEHSNLYASVTMGQRSGGYNLQMFSDLLQGAMRVQMMDGIREGVGNYLEYLAETNPNIPAAIPDMVKGIMAENMPKFEVPTTDQVVYKPEYSINYEVGSHLTLPNSRIRLDAALFWSEIRNQQITCFAPTGLGRMMVNAGESRSLGGELSFNWQATDHLSLTANYGFTEAKFQKYDDGSEADYSDNFVPFVPQNTCNIDISYGWDIARCSLFDKIELGANAQGAGRVYWNEANTSWQDFYLLPGARISLEGTHGSITLWGKNLTDTRYNSFAFTSVGLDYEQHGKPLQIGVDLKVKF